MDPFEANPNMSQASRAFRYMSDMITHYHAIGDRRARDSMAERMLLYSALPNALRIRALMVLSSRSEDPVSADECAREAVRLLDEDVRASALESGHTFPEHVYSQACEVLRLTTIQRERYLRRRQEEQLARERGWIQEPEEDEDADHQDDGVNITGRDDQPDVKGDEMFDHGEPCVEQETMAAEKQPGTEQKGLTSGQ